MAPVMLAAIVLLSGCGDEKRDAARAAASAAERVRKAAEQNILAAAAAPTRIQFRGMQVYRQAMPRRNAVCGQVNPFVDDPNIFVPFVSLVIAEGGQDGRPRYQFEQHVATTTSEASRVYLAIVEYCYDEGGPTPGPYHSVMPMPPFPDTIPDPRSRSRSPTRSGKTPPEVLEPAKVTMSDAVPERTSASGSVSMRRNANLHARPHGPALQVVPQGTVMRVFSQAPGGWLQVGDTRPLGWIHESMLDRR